MVDFSDYLELGEDFWDYFHKLIVLLRDSIIQRGIISRESILGLVFLSLKLNPPCTETERTRRGGTIRDELKNNKDSIRYYRSPAITQTSAETIRREG